MNKKIFLYLNPEFNKRNFCGIEKLYNIFCIENNFCMEIINDEFLKKNMPGKVEPQTLVIAGGDGSIHRVINTIPEEMLPRYKFGIIPGGTANEMAKTLNLPLDISEAARIIANATKYNIKEHYLAIANDKVKFLTGILYGIASDVLIKTPKPLKFLLGTYAYNFKGFFSLMYYKNYISDFVLNNKKIKSGYLIVNNASLKSKELTDNEIKKEEKKKFSLVYLNSDIKIRDILRLSVKNQLHKNILHDPSLHYEQSKNISIKFAGKKLFLLDGENYKFKNNIEIKHMDKKILLIQNLL